MRLVAPERAEALIAGIIAAVRPVGDFPRIGRRVPGFDRDSLREVIFQNYRIVYALHGQTVSVARVFHGSMDIETRLRELEDETRPW